MKAISLFSNRAAGQGGGLLPAMAQAVRACLPVYPVLFRHTPGHVVAVVLAALLSQLSLLMALWLPWKLLVVLTRAAVPTLLPQALEALPQKTQVLALCGATLLAYVIHLLAEKSIDVLSDDGAGRLWAASDKTGLFNNQQQVARLAYRRLLRSLVALVIVAAVMVLLGWLHAPVLVVLVLWCVGAAVLLHALLACWPRLMHWLRASLDWLLGVFVFAGFFCALAWVVWEYWNDALPPLFVLLATLILLRQALQQIALAVRWVCVLQQQHRQIHALFLPNTPWHAPVLSDRPFDHLLAPEPRAQWVARLLASQAGCQCAAVQIQNQLMDQGNVAALFVQATDTSGASQGFLVKLFSHQRDATAHKEADLLRQHAQALPAFGWVGAAKVQGHHCLILRWNPAWLRLPAGDRSGIQALRVQLLAHEPAAELVERYRRSHLFLWQRFQPHLFDALLDAADETQREDVRRLQDAWPQLLATVQRLPLQLVLPGLADRPIYQDDAGHLRLHHWAAWRLDPVGDGWPLSDRMEQLVEQALAQAMKTRPLLAGVVPAHACDAARLSEFERRCSQRNHRGALNLVAGLLKAHGQDPESGQV